MALARNLTLLHSPYLPPDCRAIAHHWGVSEFTVRDWRYAVPSPLDGTNVSPRSKPEGRCKLLGRYSSLQAEPGDTLHCDRLGDVVVGGMTNSPIPWPFHRAQRWQKTIVGSDGRLGESNSGW
jgi:hypothetical protein